MVRKNFKGRCERRTSPKAEGICRFYSKIQAAYADKLDADESIVSYQVNVIMDGLELGDYTTDFVCKRENGEIYVRECVERRKLFKPLTVKMLDASWDYWRQRGIKDWGLVVEKEAGNE